MRSLSAVALVVGCLALPLQAQRAGGARGGGFGGGGHASGGFGGGGHFGNGFSGSGARGAFSGPGVRGGFGGSAPARGIGAPSYRGYPAGARPGFGNRFASPGLRQPGFAARGVPSRVAAGRPAFYNRAGTANRFGYRGGNGYRGDYGPYGLGYRNRGFYPYAGFGYSPFFFSSFVGWDFLDWDTLGWNSPGWDYGPAAGYNAGYGSAYNVPAPPPATYPQSSVDDAPAPAAEPQTSRPSPLLPQAYERSAPSQTAEDVTTIVFKDGRPPVQVRNYAMTRTALVTTGVHSREIPLDEIDVPATERANRQAGVTFRLP